MLERETIYVPANKLCVLWVKAQRTLDHNWVQLICENWNRDLFDDLLVAGPDGDSRYHVVEGMHRVEVVKTLFGMTVKVPCRLVSAGSSPEAARVWALVNKSKKPAQQVELFDIKVEGADPVATAINRIIRRHGLHIGANRATAGEVSAVAALVQIYNMKSKARPLAGDILDDTLTILVGAWGLDAHAYPALMLKGVAMFVRTYAETARYERLTDVLRVVAPAQLILKAKANRLTRNAAHSLCEELVMQYNYKLPAHTRLKLDEI